MEVDLQIKLQQEIEGYQRKVLELKQIKNSKLNEKKAFEQQKKDFSLFQQTEILKIEVNSSIIIE